MQITLTSPVRSIASCGVTPVPRLVTSTTITRELIFTELGCRKLSELTCTSDVEMVTGKTVDQWVTMDWK